MNNIVRQETEVVHHEDGSVQRLTLVTLKRPIIRWLGSNWKDHRAWIKTRYFVVSTVTLDHNGILNGPFIESMAFGGHHTNVFHDWYGGVSLGESRFYPKDVSWNAQKMIEGVRAQERRLIRQVAKGCKVGGWWS